MPQRKHKQNPQKCNEVNYMISSLVYDQVEFS